jgi:hypothetical protein
LRLRCVVVKHRAGFKWLAGTRLRRIRRVAEAR